MGLPVRLDSAYSNLKNAFVAGVPTAISYDVVACGNRRGVLYEMLKADTLSKFIEKNW